MTVHPTAVIDAGAELGEGTRVWHFCHVSAGAHVGRDCVLGQNAFLGEGVRVGDRVHLQNNVSVYAGVTIEDEVFVGPSAVFTNVRTPRVSEPRRDEFVPTLVRRGASIGANATIVCGVTIGAYAMIGAGAVVTHDVPEHALVTGVPAVRTGWVCTCGEVLTEVPGTCGRCSRRFAPDAEGIREAP